MSKLQACNFIKKETLAQVLSCEICEISKNTFFTEHLQMTASTMNSLYIPHDLMRGKIGSYAYMQTRTVKKCPKKYIDIKQQNQNRAAISWKKKFVLFWKCIIFCNNLLNQTKEEVDKVFLVKQQTNLVKIFLGEKVGMRQM